MKRQEVFGHLSEETILGKNFDPLTSLGLMNEPEFHNKLLVYLLTVPGDHGYGNVFLKKTLKSIGLEHLKWSRVWVESNILIPPTKIEAAAGMESQYSINILVELDTHAVLIINGFRNDEINEGEVYRALRYAYQKYGRHQTTIVHLSTYGFLPFWTSIFSTALVKISADHRDEAEPFQRTYPKQIKLISMKKDILPMMGEMTKLFPKLPISDFLKNYRLQAQAKMKPKHEGDEADPTETRILIEFTTILTHAIDDAFKDDFYTEQKILVFGWKNQRRPISIDDAFPRKMAGTKVIDPDFQFFVGVLEFDKLILAWRENSLTQAASHLGYQRYKGWNFQTTPLNKLLRNVHLPLRENWKEELKALAISWIQSTVIPEFEAYRNYEPIGPDTVIAEKELWKIIIQEEENLQSLKI
ncbi:MAG: hypothetical protein WBG42_03075 [Cryomorphaceae bacterium]